MRNGLYWLIAILTVSMLSAAWSYTRPINIQKITDLRKDKNNSIKQQHHVDLMEKEQIKQQYTILANYGIWSFETPAASNAEPSKAGNKSTANGQTLTTYKLVGISQIGQNRIVLFLNGEKIERFKQGQSLPDGWTIKTIEPDRVTLGHMKNGQKEIRLYKGEE